MADGRKKGGRGRDSSTRPSRSGARAADRKSTRASSRKSGRKRSQAKQGSPSRSQRRKSDSTTGVRNGPRRLRIGAGVVALVAIVLGFVASGWVLRQDRIVVSRFEGRRFAVPSKVLSAPTILYPGLDWERAGLAEGLHRLGYQEVVDDRALAPSRFRWRGDELEVHLRAFEHPTRPEPARHVTIRVDGSYIAEIRDESTLREVGAVLLEPELVGAYYGPDREQRNLVRLRELPEHLGDAILAVEDQRFERHHGLDPRRIAGAALANLRAGRIRQGGSTLTQQLVKNFFLTPEQTLGRKLTEAVMALLVEARYDKEEILESYLNEIYLGQRGATEIHGVGEAASFYFGRRARDLSVAECALLAAIVQSPNRMSPHRHPERAMTRRNLVLGLMLEQGRISRDTHDAAVAEPIRVATVTTEESESRYFLDFLRRQLPEAYDRDVLQAEGLAIYSTLDPRLQRAAVRALRGGLERLERDYPELRTDDPEEALQGCLIAMRPQTGEVVALVGGRDYGVSQFDRCTQARRQAGSTFKTFSYIAALEPGPSGQPLITTATLLSDAPLEIETSSGVWRPRNYDHKFRGPVTARYALERSLNVPAIRLGMEVGLERVRDVARRLGVTSHLPNVPSLPLGTADVAPIEIARAYSTIANGGIRPFAHTFEDVAAGGETLAKRKLEFERVLGSGVAYLATSLLQGVVDRGTGIRVRSAGIRGAIAGKTGTTDNEHDLWFVGFTPELVAVVWVGFDDPRPVGVQSSWGALPIWSSFILEAVGPDVRGVFPRPQSVRESEINPETGALAMAGCPIRATEYFLRGTEPTEICSARDDPALASRAEPATRGGSNQARERRPERKRSFWDRLFGR